ncbi:2184_t:CDS:1, partial [Paraglomus occultum]
MSKDSNTESKTSVSTNSSATVTAVSLPSSLESELAKLTVCERLNRYVNEIDEFYSSDKVSSTKAKKLRNNAIDAALANIKQSMMIDICFVLDCTGSMSPHIAAAKDSILQVAKHIQQTNPGFKTKLGFCGYRDIDNEDKRLERFDFIDSYKTFSKRMSTVVSIVNKDGAEDVLGGLNAAVNEMSWRNGTRIILHIGDCPPHGNRFHGGNCPDHYPLGDPNGLTAEGVLESLQNKNILYCFGKITAYTDTMINVFQSILGAFPVFDLVGGDPIALIDRFKKATCTAITSSVTLTSTLGTDSEDIYSIRQKKLEMNKQEPEWEKALSHSGVVFWYDFPTNMERLKIRSCFVKEELFSEKFSFKMSEQPFSAGSEKYAYFGLDITRNPTRNVVIKEYLKMGYKTNPIEKYLEAVEVSTIAAYLARKFNSATKRMNVKNVNFVVTKVLRAVMDNKNKYYIVEQRFEGATFERFNVNSGVVVEMRPVLEAFAHFTYECTKHYLVVYDLQGIELTDEFLLTDPAIHCVDPLRFGRTNL